MESNSHIETNENISTIYEDYASNDKRIAAKGMESSKANSGQVLSKKDSFKHPKNPLKGNNAEVVVSEMNTLSITATTVNNTSNTNDTGSMLKRPTSMRNMKSSNKFGQGRNKFISIKTIYLIGNVLKCNDLIQECLRIWVDGGMDKFNVITISNDCNYHREIIDKLSHIITTNNNDNHDECGFLLDDFIGPIYDYLTTSRQVIFGPTFITEFLTEYGVTPIKLMGRRPIYCSSMLMITVVFSGFDEKDHSNICQLSKKISFMGGHIRNMIDSSTTTHVVASSVFADLYQDAMDMNIPIVTKEWIEYCWEHRNEIDYVASMDTIEDFEMKPFYGLCIVFVGFSSEELNQFEEIAHDNGASVVQKINNQVTHIVCEDKEKFLSDPQSNIKSLISKNIIIMSINWFWRCIHTERYFSEECVNMNTTTTSKYDDSTQIDMTESMTSILYGGGGGDSQQQPTTMNTSKANEYSSFLPCPLLATFESKGTETNTSVTFDELPDISSLNDDTKVDPIKQISLKKQSTLSGAKSAPITPSMLNKQMKSCNISGFSGFSDGCDKTVITTQQFKVEKNDISNDVNKSITGSDARTEGVDISFCANNISSTSFSPNKSFIKPKIFHENVPVEVIKKMSSLVKLASISAHSPKINIDSKIIHKRELIIDELLSTETNYVKTLKTIVDVFYKPLDRMVKSSNKPIICAKDLKFVFAAFPQILTIHSSFLNDLIIMKKHMAFKHICVGTLLLDHIERYPKAYSPLVNYYDLIYSTIKQWDETIPRFHAFLKSCEIDARCNRETLQQLIIRPIQRLPSTLLLLNQIVDLVNPAEPDYKCLTKSIKILKDITKSLNEGKRVLESKMRVFSIINNVEKCPASIVSFGRDLIIKFDAVEKTNSKMFTKNGRYLVIYLLTDGVEIATKKLLKILSKSVINSAKYIVNQPTATTNTTITSTSYIDDVNNVKLDKDKPFKHFLYLESKNIHSIYNIIPNKIPTDSESSIENNNYNFSTSNNNSNTTTSGNNTIGLLYYVDQYHYNFIYFKINGKNASSDKETFMRELGTKIAHHRKLDSYQQAIIETSQMVSRKDDLIFTPDDASNSDMTFTDDTPSVSNLICNSSGSITNIQSPFRGRISNLLKLKDMNASSNHSIMSGTMIKLKKAKKNGRSIFSSNTSKPKLPERSCSTVGTCSKYSKKQPINDDTKSFCSGTHGSDCNFDDDSSKSGNIIHKKKRESIPNASPSRFSFSIASWKRSSTFGSSLSKKDCKSCKSHTTKPRKNSKLCIIQQYEDDESLQKTSSTLVDDDEDDGNLKYCYNNNTSNYDQSQNDKND